MVEFEMIFATLRWPGWKDCVDSWWIKASRGFLGHTIEGKSILEAYQEGFQYCGSEVLGFCHDDVIVHEQDWDVRVRKEFENPTVGLVGFGAGLGFGSPNLYTSPYKLSNLGRWKFKSNLRNAEAHGERFTGECDAACVDGFAMFVRREILERWGGWPQGTPVNYFVYDMALSAEVRKQGYRTRLVGIDCEHLSGKSASMVNLTDDHAAAHKWLFDHYKGTLPFKAEGA